MDIRSTVRIPELPTLAPEVKRLTSSDRVTGALQSLVLDHMLVSDGQALWVDAKNNATTTSLVRVAPSRRILDQINVARGFTAFQHYSLIKELENVVTDETTLIVVPAIEWFYAKDELYSNEGEEMLESALTRLRELSREYEIPVLISNSESSEFGGLIDQYCDSELTCLQTEFGPRFTGDEYETLVFECNGGLQTTFAFWRRILQQRHSARFTTKPQEVTHIGPY